MPLWPTLAQFTSDDLDEGLNANAAFINKAKPTLAQYYNVAFVVSLFFGFLFIVSLMGLLLSATTKSGNLFSTLTLATFFAMAAPHIWWQLYQYGLKTPDIALGVPHAPDRHFDEFLGYLQKASGPRA